MASSPRSSQSPPEGGSSPPRGPPRSPPPPSSSPPPPPPRSPPPPSSSPPPRSPPPPSSPPPPPPPRRSPPPPSSRPPPHSPIRSTPPRKDFGASTPSKGSPPPPPANKSHKSHTHKTPHRSTGGSSINSTTEAIIIGLVLAGFLILAFVIICVTCARRRRKKRKQRAAEAYYMKPPRGGDYYKDQWAGPPHDYVIKFKTPGMMVTPVGAGARWASPQSSVSGSFSAPPMPPTNMPLAFSKSHFSYDELSAATDGFSQSNLLGQGGFGYVYKGVLPDGREVAVKSLKSGSTQGEREFQAEVEIISRVHHRHLVSLVGYCIADAQRMLVYEYVSNKALDFHLHGKGCPVMNWETRIRIALGSAKGLAYLHEDCHPRIIHRDIKSSNILLDHNFEAKVADFGLAKLASGEDTHVSTRVMGTFGYLAPEYASSGKLTEKSDVFSFGVMLLELLTGRKPIDPTSYQMEDSLVEWAGPLLAKAFEDHNYNELVDPRLGGKYEADEVARMASCAAASIRHSAKRRPKMSQIVRALESSGSLDDVLKPQRASSTNQSQDTPPTSVVYDTKAYNADMRKFKEMLESSEEFTSS